MRTTYAVTWQEPDASHSGKLELRPLRLRFEAVAGGTPRTPVVRELAYEDVAEVRVGRAGADRIGDRPTLVIERRDGGPVRIASVSQAGIVSELAERLATFVVRERGLRRVVVVLPLKTGVREDVRALLAKGPPFDADDIGLSRHEIFLTAEEAVFVFEAATDSALEELVGDPGLWAAAGAWQDLVAGPARVAEDAYSWTRHEPADGGLSFAATPGPGDSEGGDLFPPESRT